MTRQALIIGLIALFAGSATFADQILDIPLLSSAHSMGEFGDPNNVRMDVNVAVELGFPDGTPLILNGIGWVLSLTSYAPSTPAESMINFDSLTSPGSGVDLTPCDESMPGTWNCSSGGIVDLGPSLEFALPDGRLRLEFFEDSNKDDFPDLPDATWNDGTISIRVVPEPGTPVLLAIGMLALRRR